MLSSGKCTLPRVRSWGPECGQLPIPPGATSVEVIFTPDAAGTQLRLRHSNLEAEEWRQGNSMGWDHYLPRLVTVAEGADPGPDPWVLSDIADGQRSN